MRSSGAGMGCPDWPKCFDHYIPPTDVSQLPKDYQEKYVAQRLAKNEKFAKMLDKMGYRDLADKVRHDESIKIPEEFNVTKTYTEYINRLAGALIGVFVFLTFISSFYYLKAHKRIVLLSLINVFLLGFQAWLGSIVVSTNLLAWTITVHMIVAVLILAIAIYTYHYARSLTDQSILAQSTSKLVKLIVFGALLLSFSQIIIGTELRETIDAIIQAYPGIARSEWLEHTGKIYLDHKLLAVSIVLSNLLIFFMVKKNRVGQEQLKYAIYGLFLVVLQYILGLILNFFAMPPAAQALHMVLATLMFGEQFYLFLMLRKASVKMGGN